ncbi:CatA-like O-acetyltransferase [Undibacterium griseum]|uniref:Chloramphenicol acetyltransferase n=1 Tax=Undibacterium griseum TaxID=2762295 RepID=A0ABR6YRI0_9BURK|nr:CatA-like O-acetyltransferase [Undibacterium griseum]MBC3886375.1 chloramphenicol acetyltransferase [Undibacterium griseum]
MKKILDLSSWNRREHFDFFSRLDEPFHGIVTDVNCSAGYQYCQQEGISFFLFYLHRCLQAIQKTEAMRYRIQGQQVVDYAVIHANATIGRSDHTFGFCPIEFNPDFQAFSQHARRAMDQVKNAAGLCFNQDCERDDVIHFSAMPWLQFTGITHARRHDGLDSVPKISVGRCSHIHGEWSMPVATFVHHGLVDAYHVHEFLQQFEAGLNQRP